MLSFYRQHDLSRRLHRFVPRSRQRRYPIPAPPCTSMKSA